MRKTAKTLLCLVLCLAMALSLLPSAALTAYADTPEGDFTWTLLGDNTYEVTRYNGSAASVVIPSTYNGKAVTSIGTGAFNYCTRLTSVTIPNSVTSIGLDAFEGCTSLVSITIPNSVTSIGDDAFYNCTSLTSITIPNSVTSIGYYAFYGCTSLQYNNYDNGKYLGNDNNPYVALINTTNKSVVSCTIHPDTKIIADYAFSGCTSLTSITIPDGVTSISNYAFYNCTSLTSITIPDSITSIGSDAFYNCTSLASITIPDSVTSIGYYAFYGCTSLTSITIPDSVTSIGSSAFYACSSLTSITIPNSVTSIGERAFYNCRSLTSITIPDSVTSIGAEAFRYCTSLNSVYYHGTEEEWNNISIGTQNAPLINATLIYGHIFDQDGICTVCGLQTAIAIVVPPTRINYNVGDTVSLAGMKVTVVTESGEAVEVNGEDLTLVNTTASLDDPYAHFIYTDENENVYEGKIRLNVAPRTIINTYFQISAGTTAESAYTTLRLVSGINDLDHGKAGFILSLDDETLDPALLNSRAFAKLKWTLVDDGAVKLERAMLNDKTYFRITTQTVYNSVLAGGERITSADLGTNYLFTCNFVNIPNTYFNRKFTARSFTVSAFGAGVYDYEYSQNVISYSINEMIE